MPPPAASRSHKAEGEVRGGAPAQGERDGGRRGAEYAHRGYDWRMRAIEAMRKPPHPDQVREGPGRRGRRLERVRGDSR